MRQAEFRVSNHVSTGLKKDHFPCPFEVSFLP